MNLQHIIRYCLAGLVCGLCSKVDAAVPAAPENLQPAWLFGEIMLTWNEVPEAAGYNIYRYDEANAVWVPTATNVNVPRYREMNVTEPTSYRVTAVNADGESAPAGPVVAEQTGEGFVISLYPWLWSIYDTQAIIQWTVDLVAGADGMLEVGTSPTNLTSFAWDTNYTGLHRLTVTNLSPGTYYLCRITSVASNRTGVSGWTSFTTLPTNNPPVAQNQIYTIYEDQYWPLQIYLGAWDPDWVQNVTISIVSGPFHGSLTPSEEWPSRNFSYLPETNWFGDDTITFVASDGVATSAPGTITISVLPMNDPFQPISQSVTTAEDTPIVIPIFANDIEGDAFTSVWIASWPMNGWVWVNGTNVIYTPSPNFSGDDAFLVHVCSDTGSCSWDPATVTIHVTAANDAPQASDVYTSAHAEATFHGSFAVSDLEGDTLTSEVVSGPSNGQVTVSGTNFTYTPNPGLSYFNDSFSYRALDGQTNSNVAAVWIWIGNTNTVPEAHDQAVIATQNKGTFFILDVTEPDYDFLQLLVQAGPTNGTIEFYGIGVTYRPATNYLGPDSFTYRVFDGTATGNIATVTIDVIPNRPPVADPFSFSVPEEWTADFTLTGSDADGDTINFVLLSQPAHGSLTEIHFYYPLTDYPGHYQYTPAPNYHGSDSFTFTWNDGLTNGNIATVNITVTPVNDAPVANAQSVTTVEDTPKAITLTASDVENDPLTFIIVSNPAHGTLAGAAPNLVYTPATNYSGSDSFTFKAYDGSSNSAVKTVTITVTGVNDAPFAFDQTVIVNEDTSTNITLTSFDPDGPNASYILFSQPTHGTLTLMQGTIRKYTPAANYHGPDSFSFIVSDGNVLGNVGTIAINVTSVNDAPDAISKAYQIPEDTSLNVNLAGLVNDADGDPLTYTILTPPGAGTLSGTPPNLVYRPNTNFWGYDHFYFKVSDGMAETPSREIWIEINSVNDAPMALNTSFTVPEDGVLALSPSSTDVDYYPATYRVVVLPSHGTLTISGSASNNWTYRPATNFSGTDSIVFIAHDLMADSNPGTVIITVTPVNDRPVADNQSVTMAEDAATSITLTGSDVDGTELSFVLLTTPAYGSVVALGPATYSYTPLANYNGPDSFSFVAQDGVTSSAPAIVSITIAPGNDAPVANEQTLTTAEETTLNITLTGSDVDNEALSYSIVSGPTNGTLTGTAPDLSYTPNTNFNGTDSFTFKVHDGTIESGLATVTIVVTPLNDPPMASAAAVTTDEDAATAIALAGSDADDDALSYAIVSAPTHGTLSGIAPNVVYAPEANYHGEDSFTFSVTDPSNNSATATVTITVTPVNDSPVASSQSIVVNEDTSASIALSGSDVDDEPLTFAVVSGPAHGTLNGSGTNLVYTPAGNFHGSDSFTFSVTDLANSSSTATVTVSVTSVNDPAVAHAQSVTTVEETPKNITLTASDVENDPLNFIVVSHPAHGALTGAAPNVVYTPAANYSGPDSFTFKVNDGTSDGDTATVSLTVTAVNDAPIATAQSIATLEDTAANITLIGSDVDGDALNYSVVNSPVHGTLTGTGLNRVYTPAAHYYGPDSFTFKVNDGTVDGNTATVSLTVTSVNDAPVANAQSVTTVEETAVNITLTGSDVEGAGLTFVIVSNPAHGTLSGSGATRVYRPATNYSGPDSFTFSANDGLENGNPATVSISITPVNDAPTANAQSVSTPYNTPVSITLTGSDPDGNALTYTVVNNPSNGTLSGTNANRTFTPKIGWSGTTSFTFKVNDGVVNSANATVTITVAAATSTPSAPSELTATAISKSQINLTWTDNASNEDGFKIERSTNGTSWNQIATVGPNVLNYSSTGLSANKLYYYRVRAYNVLGNSAYSNTASATTLP